MHQQSVSLPYDIWESIFSCVEDTRDIDGMSMGHRTLARCCLINRVLLQVAQSVLFRHYIFTLRANAAGRSSGIKFFGENSDLQRHIRLLTIRIDSQSFLDLLRAPAPELLPFAPPPQIRCDLSGFSWSELPQDLQHSLVRLLSSAQVTDVTMIARRRVSVPGTFFTQFRHLKRLTLVDLLLVKAPEGVERLETILDGISLPWLTYLSMTIHNQRSLLLFGKLTKGAPNLRTVQFKVDWPPSFSSGPVLQSLPPDYVAEVVPAKCKSLTQFEITLSHISFDQEKENPAMCGPLRRFLELMPESMEFRLAIDADEITFFGRYPGWKAVDEMLVDFTNTQPNRRVYFRFTTKLRSKTATLKEEGTDFRSSLFPKYYSAIKDRLTIAHLPDANDRRSTILLLKTSGY